MHSECITHSRWQSVSSTSGLQDELYILIKLMSVKMYIILRICLLLYLLSDRLFCEETEVLLLVN